MRIAFVSTFYYPRLRGGSEYTLYHHAEALAQRGVNVSVLSFAEGDKAERFQHHGVDCRALPVPNFRRCLGTAKSSAATRLFWHLRDVYNPAAGRLLAKELSAIRPDLVHTENLPGWSCAVWTTIRRLRLPHVQMLHDFQFTCPAATRFRDGANCRTTCARCLPFALVRKRLSQRIANVVANSDYTRQLHRHLGFFSNASRFEVIYGPAPTPPCALPFESTERGQLRVGYLGRLHPTKGLESLIDAFISAGREGAVLRIAGRGSDDYEACLRERCRGKPIVFVGHSPAETFFPSIDVLVAPSLWNEPMGRVIIEAASHGVPVIASAVGGIPELVHEGRTGWLFDVSAPQQLTELLRQITPDTLHALRPHCLEWAKRFSPGHIMDQWMALYEDLVRQPTSYRAPSVAAAAAPAGSYSSW